VALETDRRNVRSLYDVIDSDALDRLFGTAHRPQRGYVTFQFEGFNVSIWADEWIAVSPRPNDGE
jgi:hypothetical protein